MKSMLELVKLNEVDLRSEIETTPDFREAWLSVCRAGLRQGVSFVEAVRVANAFGHSESFNTCKFRNKNLRILLLHLLGIRFDEKNVQGRILQFMNSWRLKLEAAGDSVDSFATKFRVFKAHQCRAYGLGEYNAPRGMHTCCNQYYCPYCRVFKILNLLRVFRALFFLENGKDFDDYRIRHVSVRGFVVTGECEADTLSVRLYKKELAIRLRQSSLVKDERDSTHQLLYVSITNVTGVTVSGKLIVKTVVFYVEKSETYHYPPDFRWFDYDWNSYSTFQPHCAHTFCVDEIRGLKELKFKDIANITCAILKLNIEEMKTDQVLKLTQASNLLSFIKVSNDLKLDYDRYVEIVNARRPGRIKPVLLGRANVSDFNPVKKDPVAFAITANKSRYRVRRRLQKHKKALAWKSVSSSCWGIETCSTVHDLVFVLTFAPLAAVYPYVHTYFNKRIRVSTSRLNAYALYYIKSLSQILKYSADNKDIADKFKSHSKSLGCSSITSCFAHCKPFCGVCENGEPALLSEVACFSLSCQIPACPWCNARLLKLIESQASTSNLKFDCRQGKFNDLMEAALNAVKYFNLPENIDRFIWKINIEPLVDVEGSIDTRLTISSLEVGVGSSELHAALGAFSITTNYVQLIHKDFDRAIKFFQNSFSVGLFGLAYGTPKCVNLNFQPKQIEPRKSNFKIDIRDDPEFDCEVDISVHEETLKRINPHYLRYGEYQVKNPRRRIEILKHPKLSPQILIHSQSKRTQLGNDNVKTS